MKAILTLLLLCLPAFGAVKYVDPNAASSPHDGSDWAHAYTTLTGVSASAGDIIRVSGGTTSQTYSQAGGWNPPAGSPGSPVTFTYSDDAGHNGQVIVSHGSGSTICMQPTSSGSFHDFTWNFWDGTNMRCNMTNWYQVLYVNGTTNYTHVTFYGVKTEGLVEIIFAGYYYDIGYNKFVLADNRDHVIALSGPPPAVGWGTNKIHNNEFYVHRLDDGNGTGDDGIQWGNSCDIYSNLFVGVAGYTGAQHQDFIQTDGRYTRIFANTFSNSAESCIYPDCTSAGTYQDFYIYNNLFIRDAAGLVGAQRGIDAGPDTAGALTIQNYQFWNNTFVGFTGAPAIGMYDHGHANLTWTSCAAGNNVFYNCSGGSIIHVPSVLTYYNKWAGTSGNGTNNSGGTDATVTITFVNAASDFHLATNDVGAFEQGTNLVAALFAVDMDGISRPQYTNWDAGAYELTNSGSGGGGGDTRLRARIRQ